MAVIRLLDQATVNKIAAGEVVERPASVVKEMVENSIDAGASEITVEIQEGGTSLIRITDNGSGIEADQVRTAFLRHATSKIRSVEDLQSSLTLGFRGEALASVAAVSRVEMKTRTEKEETGIHYVIEGGVEYVNEEAACAKGTTIRVENLFFNTPARKKFLKKPTVEAGAITDLLQKMILGHPEVSFRYLNGKKEPTLFSAGQNNLKNSIFAVYGKDVLDKMIPVDAAVPLSDTSSMRVVGYISRPQCMRANRSYETLFINGRYVKSAQLERALDEAYKDYVVPGTFPIAVLHLEMDPSSLDVNVHPTKMEVRFMQEEKTRTGFFEAIAAALKDENLISRVGSFYKEAGELRQRSGMEPSNSFASVNSEYSAVGPAVNLDSFIPQKKPWSPWEKDKKESPNASPYLGNLQGSMQSAAQNANGSEASSDTPVTIIAEEEKTEGQGKVPSGAKRTLEFRSDWKGTPNDSRDPKRIELQEELSGKAAADGEKTAANAESDNPKSGSGLYEEKKNDLLKMASFAVLNEKPARYAPNSFHNSLKDQPAESQNAKTPAGETQNASTQMPPAIAKPYTGEQVAGILPEESASADDSQPKPKNLRLVGQIFRTYWIAEEKDIFYLVDQHAAHERVLYDKYRELLDRGNIDTQSLLEPVVCPVDPKEVASLDEYLPVLTKMGYEIEAFGEDAVIVRGVPFLFRGPLAPEDMSLVIDMCYNGQQDTARDLLIDRIATMSCKAAVKGNDAMSFEEASSLLEQLFASNNPYNCPHGRPTIISVTKYQLDKRFMRV